MFLDHKEGDEGGVSFSSSFDCNNSFTKQAEALTNDQNKTPQRITHFPEDFPRHDDKQGSDVLLADQTKDTQDVAQSLTLEQIRNNVANDIRSPKDKPVIVSTTLREQAMKAIENSTGTTTAASAMAVSEEKGCSSSEGSIDVCHSSSHKPAEGSQSDSDSVFLPSTPPGGSQSDEMADEELSCEDRRKTYNTPKPSKSLLSFRDKEMAKSTPAGVGKLGGKKVESGVTFATPPLPAATRMPTRASAKKARNTPKPVSVTPKSRFQPVRKSTAK